MRTSTLLRRAAALAVGLLVGLQRGWQDRDPGGELAEAEEEVPVVAASVITEEELARALKKTNPRRRAKGVERDQARGLVAVQRPSDDARPRAVATGDTEDRRPGQLALVHQLPALGTADGAEFDQIYVPGGGAGAGS